MADSMAISIMQQFQSLRGYIEHCCFNYMQTFFPVQRTY